MMQSFFSRRISLSWLLMAAAGLLLTATFVFSAPEPRGGENALKSHVESYMTSYDTLSTWICQGAVSGSERRDYHEAINEARMSMEHGFKTLILEKLNEDKFLDVIRIPHFVNEYLTCEKIENKLNACRYLTYPSEALKSLVPTLNEYVSEHVQRYVDRCIHTAAFAKALQLAILCETHIDQKRVGDWIVRIRDQATKALELSVKKSLALKDTPALAMDERARAERLIQSFPVNHEIRIHLEKKLNELVLRNY